MLPIFSTLQIVNLGDIIAKMNKSNNTYNYYNNNKNSCQAWKKKCYICGKEDFCSNKRLDNEQLKKKELWRQNQKFRGDKSKYNALLADYEEDLNDNIDNDNEKTNH